MTETMKTIEEMALESGVATYTACLSTEEQAAVHKRFAALIRAQAMEEAAAIVDSQGPMYSTERLASKLSFGNDHDLEDVAAFYSRQEAAKAIREAAGV